MTAQELLLKIKEDQVTFLILQFSDIHGLFKGFTIPVGKAEDALTHGVWFDGSSIEGLTRIAKSDMFLKPDPTTYGILDWLQHHGGGYKTARVVCDVHTGDGEPFAGDPRFVLKRALKRAEDAGYDMKTGVELEFFLFPKDESGNVLRASAGNGYYFNADTSAVMKVKEEIISALEWLRIEVEVSHTEVAEHQHEIDFKYADALKTADNAMSFKYVVKSIAERHNMYATFMPKPIAGINGSGMHTHQSLFHAGTNDNAFFDESDPYHLSIVAKHYIAGLLAFAKEYAALIAPTVNSYKRLTPGFEAPVYLCWARQNRSALIRIPRTFRDKAIATRVELRCPDPSANPYLAFAAMVNAGMRGIQENLELPAPTEEDVFEYDDALLEVQNIGKMPASLIEALGYYHKSDLVRDTLGEHIYREFYNAKRSEWDEFRVHVTDWEIERYFGIL